jgi:hypothetical protein
VCIALLGRAPAMHTRALEDFESDLRAILAEKTK